MNYDVFKNLANKLIEERKSIDENDPSVSIFWGKFTEFLTQKEEFTIKLLNESNAETVSYISEVFEDISEKTKSQKFIECIDKLELKFPKEHLKHSIQCAKDFMPN